MAEEQQYGGFWARLVAVVIDNAVVFVILLAAAFGLGMLLAMVGMDREMVVPASMVLTLLPILYWPVMESSKWQATVGKRVMGLEVTDFEGNRLSFVRALLRSLAKIISGIPFGIGFLIAAFTARKQALHDIIVKTLVVRTGPSQLWKIILALLIGGAVLAASAAALFYYVLMPMFSGGMEGTMRDAMKGAPQMKTVPAPAPAGKAPSAAQPKPEASAPVKPEPAPAPVAAAPVKPEPAPAPVKPEPAPAPVVAAPAKPVAAAAKPEPSAEPRPRAEPKAKPEPVPAPMAAAAPAKPGPKFNDVMTAVLYRDAAGVNELLDMGRWVDRRDSAGLTPLMVAVRLRDAQMAQLLIRRGADVNASAAAGESPLAMARKNRDAAMVELLQKSGAR